LILFRSHLVGLLYLESKTFQKKVILACFTLASADSAFSRFTGALMPFIGGFVPLVGRGFYNLMTQY